MLFKKSFKLKLILSYAAVALLSFSFIAFLLFKNLETGSLRQIKPSAVLLGLFFTLGLAFVAGAALAESLTKPINRIIRACRKFSQGDFSQRIFPYSQDEIGELAATLNKMALDIEDKIKEIKAQNQQLSGILKSMIEGVVVVDKNSRVLSLNPAIEKIFGIAQEEAWGSTFLEAIRNNDIAEVINAALKDARPISRELALSWPVRRIFQVNASAIFEGENVGGCLLVMHDITEIRKLEVMRRDFVANVSHELKTPLTSIKGFVETLLEGAIEDKEHNRHFLEIIQGHAARLENLINDLLSLSYIESQQAQLEIKDLNLKALGDDVIAGFKSQLKKKSVHIDNDLSVGLSVRADKDRLEQVITNLIDNAIKFNKEKGAIMIYSEDLSDKLKIIVEDSGCGIPPKDIPRIFERFYRVDKARSRELGGTGLGLSIVKHIVELHGGETGVESIEGAGSKFWFTLPKLR